MRRAAVFILLAACAPAAGPIADAGLDAPLDARLDGRVRADTARCPGADVDFGPFGTGLGCDEEGALVCPGGDGSDTGYHCFEGCWRRYRAEPCSLGDAGPCSHFVSAADAGPGGPVCSPEEEGRTACDHGTGWQCSGGCWSSTSCGAGCTAPGRLGSTCNESRGCEPGASCEDDLLAGADGSPPTLGALGIPPGEPDPDHPGFFRARAGADASDDPVLPITAGSTCVRTCDLAARTGTCGSCAGCTSAIAASRLLTLPEVLPDPAHGATTGWCRISCNTFFGGRGLCPLGQTCDPLENACVEACTSDVECRARIVPTWEGDRVTVLDVDATCDLHVGRCVWRRPSSSLVGAACVVDADCSPSVGVCLPGGTCGEAACRYASDTNMTTRACDGGRGVCVPNGSYVAWICIAGCDDAEDCLPGNACFPLLEAAGAAYPGICFGGCDTEPSDPDADGPLTEADDVLVPCRADERCDVPAPTLSVPDPLGVCRAPCAIDADCPTGQRCGAAGLCGVPTR